ncbi:MAG: hypothetical protein H3C69_00750 [Candidatus Promineofilum sp.]|nr:hypothetical protein [Promineifilum sp.]
MNLSPDQHEKLTTNPYIVGRPLTRASASLFFGRHDVFTWFEENLSCVGQPNALMLYGRRRIGKTSTLYQLVEGERGRALRENPARLIHPVYVDLQRYAGRPTEGWLRQLVRDIYRRVESPGDSRFTFGGVNDDESAYAAFDLYLDHLEDTLPEGGHILIALDEFEQIRSGIESGSLDADVLPFLRSQIQHRHRITFLICGALGLLDPFWNPIVNLMSRYELGMLDYEEAVALVRAPLENQMRYEDEAVEMIWRQTAGHPFLIQTICHRLVSLMNRRHQRSSIQASDVEEILRALDKEGFVRDWLGDDLSGWNFQLPPVTLEAPR